MLLEPAHGVFWSNGLRCACGEHFKLAHQEDRELIENTTEREAP